MLRRAGCKLVVSEVRCGSGEGVFSLRIFDGGASPSLSFRLRFDGFSPSDNKYSIENRLTDDI